MNEEIRIGKKKRGCLRPVLAIVLTVAGSGAAGSYVIKINAGLETINQVVHRLGDLEQAFRALPSVEAVVPPAKVLPASPVPPKSIQQRPLPSAPPAPAPAAVAASWQQQMLSAHNDWRRVVNVPPLVWSAELEKSAQRVVDQLAAGTCEMIHSGSKYGENLHKSGPLKWTDGRTEHHPRTPAQIVAAWGSEADNYRWADNACSGVCGHYTQLVWKATKAVGCARARCENNSDIAACQYDPSGNVLGQRPF